jgi:O-antigen/teichoic acid export membrane protein
VLNFLGLAVPLALAFFVMPIAARYLGAARFGLLGLAWAVTEYLTLFDLGLGRALVKFVADALHHESAELNEIVSLSVAAQVVTGMVGGAVFVLAAPVLVHDVFRIGPATANEAIAVFRVVGLSVPVVLLISAQRGVLEGAQRFDLSATLKMLTSVVSLSIPAVGAVYGASLPAIMFAVLVSRILICVLYAWAIRRALPTLRWIKSRDWALVRRIFSFGGWVLVSNTISPLLVYFDRFALGTIGGLAAVGFYTAPYEGVTRMLLVPVSLIGTLLPALTAIEARAERAQFTRLAASAERTLIVAMSGPLSFVLVFAPEILRLWLGAHYAVQSATAFRLLAVGVFANTLAQPLLVMLYAKNRPDLPAKFHVVELVIHLPLTIILIRAFGIAGAAAAWTTRTTLDMCLLFWAAARSSNSSVSDVAGGRVGRAAACILLLIAALALSRGLALSSPIAAIASAITAMGAFTFVGWSFILGEQERAAISGIFHSYFASLVRPPRSVR